MLTNMRKLRMRSNKPSYAAIHNHIRRKFGNYRICDNCKTTKAKWYDWANKSHKYKNDRRDWMRLCRSCHLKYDMTKELKGRISKGVSRYWKNRIWHNGF